MIVLHELLNNVETVRSVAGGSLSKNGMKVLKISKMQQVRGNKFRGYLFKQACK